MPHILDNKWFTEESKSFNDADIKYVHEAMMKYIKHLKKIYKNLPQGIRDHFIEENGTAKIQFHDVYLKKINITDNFIIENEYYDWETQKNT